MSADVQYTQIWLQNQERIGVRKKLCEDGEFTWTDEK